MAKIAFDGNPVHTSGQLPEVGVSPMNFKLMRNDLSEVSLESYAGKKKVFNIFPSIDTPVCADSVRKFNELASELNDTVVLNVSADLPFAQKRFCGSEGIKNCETLSCFRSSFGKDWGVEIVDSKLAGLLSRAIVILDAQNKVIYNEQVEDIVKSPNYGKALLVLREM